MRLVEAGVLACEHDRARPEVLVCLVRVKPLAQDFRFTDVDRLSAGRHLRRADQDVDARAIQLRRRCLTPILLTKTASGFSPNTNAYRYDGRRFDTGSGTVDFGARRYSASTGRFIQRDSYFGALDDLDLSTDPINGNRYALTGANPINFVEFDGHKGGWGGFASEAWRSTKSGVADTYSALRHPVATANALSSAVNHPIRAAKAMAQPVRDAYKRNGIEGAEGALLPTVVIAVVGTKGAGLLTKGASAARAAKDLSGAGRAAKRAGETVATRAGRQAHAERTYPEGFKKEVTLPSGKRMDAYNPQTKVIEELKPNNPRAIARGQKQVAGYCEECNRVHGPGHTGRVVTYDASAYRGPH